MAIAMTALFVSATFFQVTGVIDLNTLEDYADQPIPDYILKDNSPGVNPISDAGATLGRVLFYDKNLSVDNTISCASCHQQEFAFGDPAPLSTGVDGLTGRHSMRLVNARFGDEVRFFWDERANTLEQQTTMPIQDHVEMGFSGENGDPGLDSLIVKLEAIGYYQQLFEFVYGDPEITEVRMRLAMAQFVRSMQSFDSKFDVGRAQAPNNAAPFPNFTQQENLGKTLFLTPSNAGGAGCNGCHRAPEFDIDPNSLNNGVIGVAGQPGESDFTVTRSPSLRDVVNPNGLPNGPFMHNGVFGNLLGVVNHYNLVPPNPANDNLDPRLGGGPGNPGQDLQLTNQEKDALIAFLGTLTGQDVYTNEKWSDPFDEDGNLTVIPFCGSGIFTTIDVSICEGEIFEGYAQTGTYTDLFTAFHGCDSTRTLNLTVLPQAIEVASAEICEGEVFEGYSQTGVYEDVFQAANGCDSTRTLALVVLPQAETNITAEICEGEDFEGFTQTGVYESVFEAANGCDSIRILTLTVLPADDPVCSVSAAGQQPIDPTMVAFPNPFGNEIQLRCDCTAEVEYSLVNAQGMTLIAGKANLGFGSVEISAGALPVGVYLLIVRELDENGYFMEQVVKR